MRNRVCRKKSGFKIMCLCAAVLLIFLTGCQYPDSGRRTDRQADRLWEGLLNKKEPAERVSEERYAYTTLDEETKPVYDEIYQVLSAHEEKVTVSTMDTDVLDAAYRAVSADYGGIFWASGYVYTQYVKGDVLLGLTFAPEYTMSEKERGEMQRKIDEETAVILSGIAVDASDYEKARYVFEYLASNVDYDLTSADNQNIISVFIHKKTVCQGYASATQYLLDQLGIQSAIITGSANGGPHAWNLVRLNDSYYYLDTTWGNSAFQSAGKDSRRFVNYNYFAVTTDDMEKTHTADVSFTLPVCTATEDNYYVREGLYFSDWEPDALGNVCQNAYAEGRESVAMKFASEDLYVRAKSFLIDEGHIAEYLNGISSLYYVEDQQQNVLALNFR